MLDLDEFDELVAGCFAELDLGGSSDVATAGPSTSRWCATKALLSKIFISALPVLSAANLLTV